MPTIRPSELSQLLLEWRNTLTDKQRVQTRNHLYSGLYVLHAIGVESITTLYESVSPGYITHIEGVEQILSTPMMQSIPTF